MTMNVREYAQRSLYYVMCNAPGNPKKLAKAYIDDPRSFFSRGTQIAGIENTLSQTPCSSLFATQWRYERCEQWWTKTLLDGSIGKALDCNSQLDGFDARCTRLLTQWAVIGQTARGSIPSNVQSCQAPELFAMYVAGSKKVLARHL